MNSVADGAPRAPELNILAVCGAGTVNVRSTAAINLAVAFAAAGRRVELRDLDPAARAFQALAAGGDPGGPPVELPISRPLAGRVSVAAGFPAATAAGTEPAPELLLLDCLPRADEVTERALALAQIVVVPVDASPAAFRALAEVAALLAAQRSGDGPRLRVALARVLPRPVDRWGVVEEITEHYPGALYVSTVPLGRRPSAPTGEPSNDPPSRVSHAPTLYAPTTRAAAAYSALALEIGDDLGWRV